MLTNEPYCLVLPGYKNNVKNNVYIPINDNLMQLIHIRAFHLLI